MGLGMTHLRLFYLLAILAVAASQQQAAFFLESPNEKTVFHHPIKRVAVVGAGPAGLQAAAKLREHKFEVRLFDRAPGPGGNWFYTEETPVRESYPDRSTNVTADIPDVLPAVEYYAEGQDGLSLEHRWTEHWQPRPVWESLHTNSPAVITELPEVPYRSDTPWILSNHDIQRHVRAYASLHSLNVNDNSEGTTAYSTKVEKLEKNQTTHNWRLVLRKLTRLDETKRIKVEWWAEEFDAVVIATGPYVAPHVPNIRGIVDWSNAKLDGQHSIYHSQSYRRPQRYQDKHVLVIGASVSASEISRDIAPYVKSITASVRPHENLHPFQLRSRLRFPPSTEFVPEIAAFEPLGSYNDGIKNGRITLVNGTVLTGFDEIIIATGFLHSNVFFPEYEPDGQPKNLHWTGHYIPDPTLAYTNVRPWTIGRYQSYAFAKVWEGTAHLPTRREMAEDYESGKYHFRGLFATQPAEALFRQYVTWLNNESLENGGRLVEPWPLENREVFVYYSNLEWLNGYSSLENFTEFENLAQREWGSHNVAWDAILHDAPEW